jgi:hemerythrin-like domain-containing protein
MKDGSDSVNDIKRSLNDLVYLYPAHIEKEDQHFFYPILEYFSSEEQKDMLTEFWEFDRNMIHERYRMTLEQFEGNK